MFTSTTTNGTDTHDSHGGPAAGRDTALTLPPGRMHQALWVSDDPITDPALYLACVAAFPRTGRWPILIPHDPRFEAVWWRCHRRLIADVMLLEHGAEVLDLMHSGKQTPHAPSEGARLGEDGHVVWDLPDEG